MLRSRNSSPSAGTNIPFPPLLLRDIGPRRCQPGSRIKDPSPSCRGQMIKGGIVFKTATLASVSILAVLFVAGIASAQTDPGVQSGNRGTGAALSSVSSNSPSGILSFFTDGQARLQEVESVSGGATN